MLVLATFQKLLTQVLSPPNIHTVVLSSLNGHLISYVSSRKIEETKDEIRMIVGLAWEVWNESRAGLTEGGSPRDGGDEDGIGENVGMAETEARAMMFTFDQFDTEMTEIGKLLVQPVYTTSSDASPRQPLVLLSFNASDDTEWRDIFIRAEALAKQISIPLSSYGETMLFKDPTPQRHRTERTSRRR